MRGPFEHRLRLFVHLFRMCVRRTLTIVLFYGPLRCLEDAMSFRLPKSVAHLHRNIYGAHPPMDQNFFNFMGFVANLGKIYGWRPSFMVDNLKRVFHKLYTIQECQYCQFRFSCTITKGLDHPNLQP